MKSTFTNDMKNPSFNGTVSTVEPNKEYDENEELSEIIHSSSALSDSKIDPSMIESPCKKPNVIDEDAALGAQEMADAPTPPRKNLSSPTSVMNLHNCADHGTKVELATSFSTMLRNFAELEANYEAIQHNLASVQSTISNNAVRRHNQRLLEAKDMKGSLRPIHKEKPGLGGRPPLLPRNSAELTLPSTYIQIPRKGFVGEACPMFPANLADANEMTYAQLAEVSIWLNDGFGVVASDSLPQRREKFVDFICGSLRLDSCLL